MKKYWIITIIIFSSIIGFWSCNDDEFLTEKPESSYAYSAAYNTSTQISDIITDIYVEHKNNAVRSYVNDGGYWFLNGNGTDVLDAKLPGSEPVTHSNYYNWSTDYQPSKRSFDSFYKMIAKANMALFGAEQVIWPNENEKNLMVGEAHFWRGYTYLNLTELWGGIFIVEEFSETPKFDFQRSSRKDSYLYAISELETALTLLPDYNEAGRPGKGAIWHFLAEAYLALANDQNDDATYLDKSIAAASEAMKLHSLMKGRFGVRADPEDKGTYQKVPNYFPDGDVYFDLFQRGNTTREGGNTEALWLDKNSTILNTAYNWDWGKLMYGGIYGPIFRNLAWKDEYREEGALGQPYNSSDLDEWGVSLNFSAYIGGRGQSRSSPTDYSSYGVWENCGGDVRNSPVNIRREFEIVESSLHSFYGTDFRLTIDNVRDYMTEETAIYFMPIFSKLCPIDDWGWELLDVGRGNRNYIYRDEYWARLAETYLLRAEAYLRKGDKTRARDDINEIRGRVNAPLITENEVTIDYILDERIRELFCEERRWNTLLRMGGTIPTDRIFKYSYYSAEHGSTQKFPVNFLFPIPQNVIDSNLDAEIEQNECWKSSQ